MPKPRDVAIVGVYATEQERVSQRTSQAISMEAILGALDDAGLTMADVDAYYGSTFPLGNGQGATDGNLAYQLNRPLSIVTQLSGAMALLQAAAAIRDGLCEVAILGSGNSRAASDGSVVDWTRPDYEFTEWTGSMTPGQMAMQMRRHMHEFGTTPEQIAHGCAVVRNNGHINPDAVMFNRGPYTTADVARSPHGRRPLHPPHVLHRQRRRELRRRHLRRARQELQARARLGPLRRHGEPLQGLLRGPNAGHPQQPRPHAAGLRPRQRAPRRRRPRDGLRPLRQRHRHAVRGPGLLRSRRGRPLRHGERPGSTTPSPSAPTAATSPTATPATPTTSRSSRPCARCGTR